MLIILYFDSKILDAVITTSVKYQSNYLTTVYKYDKNILGPCRDGCDWVIPDA